MWGRRFEEGSRDLVFYDLNLWGIGAGNKVDANLALAPSFVTLSQSFSYFIRSNAYDWVGTGIIAWVSSKDGYPENSFLEALLVSFKSAFHYILKQCHATSTVPKAGVRKDILALCEDFLLKGTIAVNQ
jgi:hypothetical protein